MWQRASTSEFAGFRFISCHIPNDESPHSFLFNSAINGFDAKQWRSISTRLAASNFLLLSQFSATLRKSHLNHRQGQVVQKEANISGLVVLMHEIVAKYGHQFKDAMSKDPFPFCIFPVSENTIQTVMYLGSCCVIRIGWWDANGGSARFLCKSLHLQLLFVMLTPATVHSLASESQPLAGLLA